MEKKIFLDVVSIKERIFSGFVKYVQITGSEGELTIYPNHTPLLTSIKPGIVHIYVNKRENFIYVSGGILEIQPNIINVLSDIAIRAKDLDEKLALDSKKEAEKNFNNLYLQKNIYKKSELALNEAIAQLRIIEFIKKIKIR